MAQNLALSGTTARHPFRKTLIRAQRRDQRYRDDHDLKLFALSFTAFFICFYTFIF